MDNEFCSECGEYIVAPEEGAQCGICLEMFCLAYISICSYCGEYVCGHCCNYFGVCEDCQEETD